MTNVKRWLNMKEGSEWVELEDHSRIVTRLQRARARNLVRLLRSLAECRFSDGLLFIDRAKRIRSKSLKVVYERKANDLGRRVISLNNRADRIEAKYLRGEK